MKNISKIFVNKIKWILLRYLVLLAFLTLNFFSYSQTEPLYSSYLFNGLSINPAYAGYKECLNANLWAKKQWFGINGAPASFILSAHSPIPKSNIALGINIFHETYGVNHKSGISSSFAYRLKINENYNLSFGLESGIINFSVDNTSLSSRMPGDPTVSHNESRFLADFSTGMFLTSDKFFAGISASHLQRHFNLPENNSNIIRNQYFLTTGYLFKLSPDTKLKPSLLIRATEMSNVQFDLNLNLLLREVLWTGISYRSTGSLIFLTQIKLSHALDLGYAIDIYTKMSSQKNINSHELMLNYRFHFKRNNITSPRYF